MHLFDRCAHLLQQSRGVLADLHEPHDDVVEVDVAQRGVVLALSPHLVQQQVPAVDRGEQVLVFPARVEAGSRVVTSVEQPWKRKSHIDSRLFTVMMCT